MKYIYLKYVIEFVLAFLLVYLYYKIFVIKKDEKLTKKKLPVELTLFIKMSKVDIKKISYKKILNRLALLNAFDIALILLCTEITKSTILKVLIALPSAFIIMLGSYKWLSYIFYKKELTKQE